MGLTSRRSPTHRADLDDPTWQPSPRPALPPRRRDWVGITLGLVGVVCFSVALVASFNDWTGVWSLAFPAGIAVSLVGRLWSWWFKRRIAATSGRSAAVS